jgi:pyrophosphatase PpaX
MRAYPVVLFDLDGTLLDSTPMIVESLRHTVRTHLDWDPSDTVLIDGIGTPLKAQFEQHQQLCGGTVDAARGAAMLATYLEHNLAIHDARIQAFAGVGAMLERLKARGARLGVVTSKSTPTARRGLDVCGLSAAFEVLVGWHDVQQHKPHPEPVRTALAALGEPAEHDRVVYVGDSPHDLYSGRAAGVATAAATWGPFTRARLAPAAPDHWLEGLHEIR